MEQPDPQNNVNIVKPVALNRLGLRTYIVNPMALSSSDRILYSNLTKTLVGEYSNDNIQKEVLIADYNAIVLDMTNKNELPPNYPIWNIIGF